MLSISKKEKKLLETMNSSGKEEESEGELTGEQNIDSTEQILEDTLNKEIDEVESDGKEEITEQINPKKRKTQEKIVPETSHTTNQNNDVDVLPKRKKKNREV
jgi:hypothetical protein